MATTLISGRGWCKISESARALSPPGGLFTTMPMEGKVMSIQSTEKVYFLFDPLSFEVKIGKTIGDPKSRLKSLRCGNYRLEFIGHVDGKESHFHARFAKQRTSGEFFYVHGALLDYLKETFPTFLLQERRSPRGEFGHDFDEIIETGKAANAAFVRNFGLIIEECVESERGCECDKCTLRDICRLTDDKFISRIGFIQSKKSAFLICRSWSSKRRRELLEYVGSLADWMASFNLFAIGSEQHDGSHAQVWWLNCARIPPVNVKQFWIEFAMPPVAPAEVEEKYFQQAINGGKQ